MKNVMFAPAVAAILLSVSACGGGGSTPTGGSGGPGPIDPNLPFEVWSSTPSDGGLGINVKMKPAATLSHPVKDASVHTGSVILKLGKNVVDGTPSTRSSDDVNILEFAPTQKLKRNSQYELLITKEIENTDGKFLAKDFTSKFTTTWHVIEGTAAKDKGRAVAMDSQKNFYVAVETESDYSGKGHAGFSDVVLTKLDPDGNPVWSRQFGSPLHDFVRDVAVYQDEIYLTGYTFGDLDGDGSDLKQFGQGDIFVAKYNSDGDRQWLIQLGTANIDQAHAIAVDDSGVYVGGTTEGDMDGEAGPGPFGLEDILAIKFSLNKDPLTGNEVPEIQWIHQAGTTGIDGLLDLALHQSLLYISGYTSGDLDGEGANTHAGLEDGFIQKLDASGLVEWTVQTGSKHQDRIHAMAVNDSGVYVTGSTRDALPEQTYAGGTCLSLDTEQPCRDIFVSRYLLSGAHQWTQQYGSNSDDIPFSLAVTAGTQLYIAGVTGGPLDDRFKSGTFDQFITQLNSDGDRLWTRLQGQTAKTTEAFSLVADGDFIYSAGATTADLMGLDNHGGADMLMTKYHVSGERH